MHGTIDKATLISRVGWYRLANFRGIGTIKGVWSAGGSLRVFELSHSGGTWSMKVLNRVGIDLPEFSVTDGVLEANVAVDGLQIDFSAEYLVNDVHEAQTTPEDLNMVEIAGPSGDVLKFAEYEIVHPPGSIGESYLPLTGGRMTGEIGWTNYDASPTAFDKFAFYDSANGRSELGISSGAMNIGCTSTMRTEWTFRIGLAVFWRHVLIRLGLSGWCKGKRL